MIDDINIHLISFNVNVIKSSLFELRRNMTIYMIVAILPFYLIKANKDYNRSGICYTGTEIVNDVFCCDNYEAVNRKCRECEKGFESTKGDPCKACAANFHGTGCVNSCECKNWESCDPVKGCVNMSTTVNQDLLTSM
ncbi:uncharacterized protein [Mytilus edulis]|uniref:uncharacterized protein n=1 Tax=Mytilus edulis TaxID=6550 RepID=UPI0039EDF730